jgi:hypothetical protein
LVLGTLYKNIDAELSITSIILGGTGAVVNTGVLDNATTVAAIGTTELIVNKPRPAKHNNPVFNFISIPYYICFP